MSEFAQFMFVNVLACTALVMGGDIWREIKCTWSENKQQQIPVETIDLEAEFEQQWLREFECGRSL